MKKIFTLIATAIIAVSANAQGSYRVQTDDKFSSGQEITSVENIKVTLGADTWNDGKAMDDKLEGYFAYTTGNTNPSDANDKKPGNAEFDASTSKGCVVFFEPTIDGHLSIGIKQNKGSEKPVWLFEGAQTEAVKVAGSEESAYILIEANVKAGKKYTLYQGGTKLGFFGFDFTTEMTPEDPDTPVASATQYLSGDSWTLSQRAGTEKENIASFASGIKLEITGKDDKAFATAKSITIDGNAFTSIKLSNGAQNTVTMPEGKVATKVTFYSYVNKKRSETDRVNYWKEVAGIDYSDAEGAENKATIMQVFTDTDGYQQNPDVIAFDLNNVSTFTFNNAGDQPAVVIAIEMADGTAGVSTVKNVVLDNGTIYNLKGQRVDAQYKGIVIKNGKKVFNK